MDKQKVIKSTQKDSKNHSNNKNIFKVKDNIFVVDSRQEFIKCIGIGSQGVVISAFDTITKTKVAIKKVPKAFEDLIDAKRIVREIKVLKFFQHFNLLGLVDIPKPPSKYNYDDIQIITELMDTDLHKIIQSKQEISDEHVKQFTQQVLRGALQLHSAGVIHRDIKPANILINKNCDLKICDFGLARAFDKDSDLTEYVVTRWQRAPEVILNSKLYTEKLDVWSIGCIIAEMIGRSPLLPGNDQLEQIHRIVQLTGTPSSADLDFIKNPSAKKQIQRLPKFQKKSITRIFKNINPHLADLLDHMLTFNPLRRQDISTCLNHPQFKEIFHSDDLVLSEKKFNWQFDSNLETKEKLQLAVWKESLAFHEDDEDDYQDRRNSPKSVDNHSPSSKVYTHDRAAKIRSQESTKENKENTIINKHNHGGNQGQSINNNPKNSLNVVSVNMKKKSIENNEIKGQKENENKAKQVISSAKSAEDTIDESEAAKANKYIKFSHVEVKPKDNRSISKEKATTNGVHQVKGRYSNMNSRNGKRTEKEIYQ